MVCIYIHTYTDTYSHPHLVSFLRIFFYVFNPSTCFLLKYLHRISAVTHAVTGPGSFNGNVQVVSRDHLHLYAGIHQALHRDGRVITSWRHGPAPYDRLQMALEP